MRRREKALMLVQSFMGADYMATHYKEEFGRGVKGRVVMYCSNEDCACEYHDESKASKRLGTCEKAKERSWIDVLASKIKPKVAARGKE